MTYNLHISLLIAQMIERIKRRSYKLRKSHLLSQTYCLLLVELRSDRVSKSLVDV